MAEEHDKGYRLLFSYPKMVEHLLRHFVGGEWLERLDFTTLEKVSERDVSPDLVRREKDLLWRLRYQGEQGEEGGWWRRSSSSSRAATSRIFAEAWRSS